LRFETIKTEADSSGRCEGREHGTRDKEQSPHASPSIPGDAIN